jgi:hypothetical protein
MVAGAVMWPRDVSTAPVKGRDSEAPTARPGGQWQRKTSAEIKSDGRGWGRWIDWMPKVVAGVDCGVLWWWNCLVLVPIHIMESCP